MRQLKLEELGRLSAEEARRSPKLPIWLIMENLRSGFNVGSFFRTADAFGIERIVLCGFTPQPPHSEIRKAALGAEDVVAWQFCATVRDVSELLPAGFLKIALEQTDVSVPLHHFRPGSGQGVALWVGNEVHGLSQQALNLCELALEIPQRGFKHSLNVAVAGGIALWHMSRLFQSPK